MEGEGTDLKVIPFERELPLEDNEFTMSELKRYMNRMFSHKVNGSKFDEVDICTWAMHGRLPENYGGNRIQATRMSGVNIYMVDGFERDDYRYARDYIQDTPKLFAKGGPKPKIRTQLYYKTAGMKAPEWAIPDNWRELGIRGCQLVPHRKK